MLLVALYNQVRFGAVSEFGYGLIRNEAGAMQVHDLAVRFHPDSAMVHNRLAESCQVDGDLPRARTHFERALELDPQNAVARRSLTASD